MKKAVAAILSLGLLSTLAIDLPARAANSNTNVDRENSTSHMAMGKKHQMKKHWMKKHYMKKHWMKKKM